MLKTLMSHPLQQENNKILYMQHLLRTNHSRAIVMQRCFRSEFDSCSIEFFYVQMHELDMHSHSISLLTNQNLKTIMMNIYEYFSFHFFPLTC